MLKFGMNLIFKLISRTTGTGSLRITTLYHKIWNYAVKFQSVVIRLSFFFGVVLYFPFSQSYKVPNSPGSFFIFQLYQDLSFRSMEFCI